MVTDFGFSGFFCIYGFFVQVCKINGMATITFFFQYFVCIGYTLDKYMDRRQKMYLAWFWNTYRVIHGSISVQMISKILTLSCV